MKSAVKKKRRRVWIAIVGVALVGIATLIVVSVLRSTRVVAPTKEDLLALMLEHSPDGPNAWPMLAEANELRETIIAEWAAGLAPDSFFAPPENGARSVLWSQKDTINSVYAADDFDDPRLRDAHDLIERFRPMLDALDGIEEARQLIPPENTDPFVDVLPSEVLYAREAAMYTMHAARHAAFSGNWSEATRCIKKALGLGRAFSRGPFLIHWLVGVSIYSRTAMEAVRLAVEHAEAGSITVDDVAALRGAIERTDWRASEWSLVLEGERMIAQHYLATMSTPSFEVSTGFVEALQEWREEQRYAQKYILSFEDVARWWDQPADKRPRITTPNQSLFGFETPASAGALFVRQAAMFDAASTQRSMALQILAIAEHKARSGAWPASLDDLPEELRYTDPTTGLPFGYELMTEDDASWPFRVIVPHEIIDLLQEDEEWYTAMFGKQPAPRKSLDEVIEELTHNRPWDDEP